MKRSEVVRNEKYLHEHFVSAHRRGDERTKADVMKHLQRNVEQRKLAR
jgi:hypothetical protein